MNKRTITNVRFLKFIHLGIIIILTKLIMKLPIQFIYQLLIILLLILIAKPLYRIVERATGKLRQRTMNTAVFYGLFIVFFGFISYF